MTEYEAAPAEEKAAKKKADLLATAKERFKEQSEAWQHNVIAAREDIRFLQLDQWPDAIKKARGNKPCLTADKLNQYVRQVVNDGRQNRPSVKVRPVEGGDDQAAQAFQGLIRDICNRSNADEAFDTALGHAAGSGFGFFRVITDYVHDRTFHQEIRVRRVRNPLAVVIGPHYLADGSDADFGFFLDDVPHDRFKRQWPKAKCTDWKAAELGEGWSTEKTMRVAEYFYREETTETFHLLVDGTMVSDEQYQRAFREVGEFGVPPIKLSREIPSYKVKWCRMTGAEILEENDFPSRYIPILPVYGNESDLDGKVTYSGLVRAAKDPQMLYNFARSMFAERVAMTPKAPWLIAEGQIEGHEDEWEKANSGEVSVLVYKNVDVDGRPVPPPQRISPTDVPAGFHQEMQLSEHDIESSAGMFKASLGAPSNEKSGKAIIARQREGDTATFHYHDNLNRAIRHLGRILVDMIPRVYDGKRVVRLLGEDGTATAAELDPTLKRPSVRIGSKVIYNLGVGTYDVELEAGPSYTTRRLEAAEAMLEMTRNDPSLWRTHGDLIVNVMDWPGKDEWVKRTKLAMPPELRQAIEQETEGPEAEARQEIQRIMDEAKAAIAERDEVLEQMRRELDETRSALKNKEAEAAAKLADAGTRRMEAETEREAMLLPPSLPQDLINQLAEAVAARVLATVVPAPETLQ